MLRPEHSMTACRHWIVALGLSVGLGMAACGADELGTAPGTTATEADPAGGQARAVSTDEARGAVEDFMEANNEANRELDTAKLVDVETGSAAALDEAYYRGQRNLLGDEAEGPTFTWEDIRVYVPRGGDYPLTFLATVRISDEQSDHSTVQLQVYEKPSEAGNWKLSQYENLPVDATLPELALDEEGYLEELDRSRLAVEPDDLPSALAALLDDPDADTVVEPNDIVDTTRQTVIDRVAEDSRDTLLHDITFDVPSSPAYPTYAFPLRDGGALVLGVTGVREVIEATEGTITVSAEFTAGLVPAGESYEKLEMRSLIAFMAEVPSRDASGEATVTAVYEGFTLARAE